MHATDSEHPRRRKPLSNCPHCGANGTACDSLHWLRAQTCCDACTGDHHRGDDAA